jgi:hypothetical protein
VSKTPDNFRPFYSTRLTEEQIIEHRELIFTDRFTAMGAEEVKDFYIA